MATIVILYFSNCLLPWFVCCVSTKLMILCIRSSHVMFIWFSLTKCSVVLHNFHQSSTVSHVRSFFHRTIKIDYNTSSSPILNCRFHVEIINRSSQLSCWRVVLCKNMLNRLWWTVLLLLTYGLWILTMVSTSRSMMSVRSRSSRIWGRIWGRTRRTRRTNEGTVKPRVNSKTTRTNSTGNKAPKGSPRFSDSKQPYS